MSANLSTFKQIPILHTHSSELTDKPFSTGGGGQRVSFLNIREVPGIVSKSSCEYSFTPRGRGAMNIGLPSKSSGSRVHNKQVLRAPICSANKKGN